MMDRKGFTLVEGLMVIAIIAVILLAIVPNVITLINKNKTKACEDTISSIITSAKMYVADNKYNLQLNCTTDTTVVNTTVTIDILKEKGYLKDIDTNGWPSDMTITYNCIDKKFSYTYEKNCQ